MTSIETMLTSKKKTRDELQIALKVRLFMGLTLFKLDQTIKLSQDLVTTFLGLD